MSVCWNRIQSSFRQGSLFTALEKSGSILTVSNRSIQRHLPESCTPVDPGLHESQGNPLVTVVTTNSGLRTPEVGVLASV